MAVVFGKNIYGTCQFFKELIIYILLTIVSYLNAFTEL